MSRFRAGIRHAMPFTIDIYEFATQKKAMLPSKKKFSTLIESQRPICLDLGGADPGRGGWTTVDVTKECDIYWDLRLPIPLPDSSVTKIYSSHLFEHLTYEQGQKLSKRACVSSSQEELFPSVSRMLGCILKGTWVRAIFPKTISVGDRHSTDTTSIDAINYVAYMGGEHKYMFDQENLLHILNNAGLAEVSERPFDPTCDRAERDFESLYAIGTKP